MSGIIVGLDNGGTANNATVLDLEGKFLVDRMVEVPSRVLEGPAVAVEALVEALNTVLTLTGQPRAAVLAIGLDTPGPASSEGVISSRGATNFSLPEWHGFDFRGALEERLGIPVVYNNDGNAAGLYAHHEYFGDDAPRRSSISAIIGTGLGGAVVQDGAIVKGANGMAGELGHIHIPLNGLLGEDQPIPACNCGFVGDVESIASLTGIKNNLLPYWLTRYPDHALHDEPILKAARHVRSYGERGDLMALAIFEQQAIAVGRLFTIAANFADPDAYFVGGGVVEAAPHFREWFLEKVRENTYFRPDQKAVFSLVPDLDMAGARGAAVAALRAVNRA